MAIYNKSKDCSQLNCANCPSDTCDSCVDGFYLNGSSCDGNILQFSCLLYLKLKFICFKFKACTTLNCASCPSNTCDQCMEGFSLSGGSCTSKLLK